MNQDTRQQILTSTLDSLVRYVNQRCHIVREDAAETDEETTLRRHLVERFLWQHTELIEDFARENPDHLCDSCLEVARDLTGVLYGSFFLEDHEGDLVTLLHETGGYRVCLPTGESLPPRKDPLEIRCAIAPVGDAIVVFPPLVVLGCTSRSFLSDLHARLACKGVDEPTSDGHVLFRRGRSWRSTREKGERSDALPIDTPAPGFHVGALAGLTGDRRRAARRNHADEAALRDGSALRSLDFKSVEAEVFPVVLEEGLALLDGEWLADIAHIVSGGSASPSLSHKRLARWVAKRIARQPSELELTLMWCDSAQFELMHRLMYTNPLSLDGVAPSLTKELYPLVPYLFFIQERGTHVAWLPPEIRSLLADIDIDAIAHARKRLDTAASAASGLATMCGIISLSDAYDLYSACVEDPLGFEQFEMALNELASCESRDSYALWRHKGTDYLVSVELSDESAPARVVRECYAEHIVASDEAEVSDGTTLVAISDADEQDFVERIRQKEAELEALRVSLLKAKSDDRPHELLPSMLQATPIEALLETDALVSLRAFVDRHIPDGEDDYEFADTFARSVVVSSVLMHESYNDALDLVRLYGMLGCEGTRFPDTLGRLITNAYNALPRWQSNGFSLEELTERLTGRHRSFAADGTELPDDRQRARSHGNGTPGSRCGRVA